MCFFNFVVLLERLSPYIERIKKNKPDLILNQGRKQHDNFKQLAAPL